MRVGRSLGVTALLALAASAAPAQAPVAANGTIVDQTPCPAAPKRTYEQYLADQRTAFTREEADAKREGYSIDFLSDFDAFVMTREEFDRRESFTAYECRRIRYMSDGLKVVGYLWRPTNAGNRRVPLVIANRGGNREFGKLTPQSFFYPFVTNGFAVVASQYRGNDGGEGREEFGGADVNDVINLLPLARSLDFVDTANVFMYGVSRGSMMAFLALKRGMRVNAVATVGSVPSVLAEAESRPMLAEMVFKELIPSFAERRDEALKERSALEWPEQIGVPLLMLHGGADWRAKPEPVLAFAQRLQSLGKTYELHVYAKDNHGLSRNRLDRDRRIVEWFRRHMR